MYRKIALLISILVSELVLIVALPTVIKGTVTTQSTTTRVSKASDGTQGNEDSGYEGYISADGRYVAFDSRASNLVPGDTNGTDDVFVHDRQTGATTRVSVASDGTQGNDWAWGASISADGRYVAFISNASNLVTGDTNDCSDAFVHDRQTGQTTRVSVASDGTEGDGSSWKVSISADGRYVAFDAFASNLVLGDTNGTWDVFVHDRQTGVTTRISIASDGTEANDGSGGASISANGRYVAFHSDASNLVTGDTNGYKDAFVHDQQTGATTRVSIASDGTQGNENSWTPSTSADGRYIVFYSDASNLVPGDTNGYADTFIHDRQTGATTRVSIASDGTQGNENSWTPFISADGCCVAFLSDASNLVTGDTNGYMDAFVHDRLTGVTARVSIASDGTQGNENSWTPFISADGRYVAFCSDASNLVTNDTNDYRDVFVHDREQGEETDAAVIPTSGGSMHSWAYHTSLTFPQGAFTDTVVVTFTGYYPGRHPLPTNLTGTNQFFDATAVYSSTGQPAQPVQPYTVTVEYSEAETGTAIEEALGLYWWSGSAWSQEGITSSVDVDNDTVTARVDHLSSFAVLGETSIQAPATVGKSVAPQGRVNYGDELTYTLVVTASPGAQTSLYDPLEGTTFVRFVEQPTGITHASGAITGALTVTPTSQITVSFIAQVSVPGTAGWTVTVTNRACIYPIGETISQCAWSNKVANSAFHPLPVPQADFVGHPRSGDAPLTVQFTSTVTGTVTTYGWSFGDGGIADTHNPTHTYESAGSFGVALVVTGPGGTSGLSKPGYITVHPAPGAPTATFSADIVSGTAPLTVTFTAVTSGTVEQWQWGFGDGGTVFTGPVVSHTYATSDTFDVSLMVSNTHGSFIVSEPNYITVKTKGAEPHFVYLPLVLRDAP
jgi:PKD repeat protein/Tol biopolymer transport system component